MAYFFGCSTEYRTDIWNKIVQNILLSKWVKDIIENYYLPYCLCVLSFYKSLAQVLSLFKYWPILLKSACNKIKNYECS